MELVLNRFQIDAGNSCWFYELVSDRELTCLSIVIPAQ